MERYHLNTGKIVEVRDGGKCEFERSEYRVIGGIKLDGFCIVSGVDNVKGVPIAYGAEGPPDVVIREGAKARRDSPELRQLLHQRIREGDRIVTEFTVFPTGYRLMEVLEGKVTRIEEQSSSLEKTIIAIKQAERNSA